MVADNLELPTLSKRSRKNENLILHIDHEMIICEGDTICAIDMGGHRVPFVL